MSKVRNIFITFGVYWSTCWGAVWLDWLFSKATDRIIYGNGIPYAIAMGVMTSLGRTVAAILAGVLIAFAVDSRKTLGWAVIVGTLYAVGPGLRIHWHLPPTVWDRVWHGTDLLFPAVACIASAAITEQLRHKIADQTKSDN